LSKSTWGQELDSEKDSDLESELDWNKGSESELDSEKDSDLEKS
jgi:hypothetical protein